MKITNSYKNIFSGLLTILFFSTSFYFASKTEKPIIVVSKQQSSLNLDYKIWDFLHLGQKRLLSSTLWIATILESDHDHYKKRDLNSWMYLRFNTIAQLEPKFYENYAFGAPYLSIIKDDLNGASLLYKKGLKQYPDDYKILYNAAFHFYFEQKDYVSAYPILRKLSTHPKAPLFVVSSLARLETKEGNVEDAYNLLSEFQNNHPKGDILGDKIFAYRYALKAQIDLHCLNILKNNNCSKTDLNDEEYILENGAYKAIQKWIPFQ